MNWYKKAEITEKLDDDLLDQIDSYGNPRNKWTGTIKDPSYYKNMQDKYSTPFLDEDIRELKDMFGVEWEKLTPELRELLRVKRDKRKQREIERKKQKHQEDNAQRMSTKRTEQRKKKIEESGHFEKVFMDKGKILGIRKQGDERYYAVIWLNTNVESIITDVTFSEICEWAKQKGFEINSEDI